MSCHCLRPWQRAGGAVHTVGSSLALLKWAGCCSQVQNLKQTTIPIVDMRATSKVVPPMLLRSPTVSEVNTGGMVVEFESSH